MKKILEDGFPFSRTRKITAGRGKLLQDGIFYSRTTKKPPGRGKLKQDGEKLLQGDKNLNRTV